MGGCGGNLFEHVIAFYQFAERGVLVIDKVGVAMTDKELAAGRIRIIRSRHGKNAAVVLAIVEFGLDFVARIARSPLGFLAGILCQRIAALNHKILNDTMETSAVIESLPGKGLEVFDRFRRHIRPKLYD